MAVTTLNTNASLSGKTITVNENNDTITGNKTFDRGASTAPFTVAQATASTVTNLDADKLDAVQGANYARWDGAGTSLGQIKFPATQSASGDANTLDDYEEGTFTPTITFGGSGSGVTTSTANGSYTKVGNFVSLELRLTLTSNGTGTGAASIGIGAAPVPTGTPVCVMDIATGGASLTGYFAVISGGAILPMNMTSTGRSQLTDVNLTDSADIRISAHYRV